MSTKTLNWPHPYPLQADILWHPARFKIVATGRRSGKTTMGVYRTSRGLVEQPGQLAWWVAPTNQASFLAWERFKVALGDVATEISQTRKRLVLPNGSELWCSDGTPGGTTLVRELQDGYPSAATVIEDRLFFFVEHGEVVFDVIQVRPLLEE